ncbi:hypothetical protein BGZ83_010419 [Gryganskiella cystojenkinii]|nr:hypothetical protein BGZ83_010419 [Gryganskiella cystojenkinii]
MTLDTLSPSAAVSSMSSTRTKPLALRNLQPRAAAAVNFAEDSDFEDDSDFDDVGGSHLLSADYRAQRRTTQELVDFFKSAPPPSPRDLQPIVEEKKKTLLQRLRSRKLSASLGSGNSLRPPLPDSAIIGGPAGPDGKGTVATLPNGKKYIMIAVDYQDKDGSAIPGRRPGSMDGTGSRRESIMSQNPSIQVTTTTQENGPQSQHQNGHLNQNYGQAGGNDGRRSIIIQAGGGEGSSFILDNTPFLLDNFGLDNDFIMPSKVSLNGSVNGHRRTGSAKSGQSQQSTNTAGGEDMRRGGSKRGNKVKFNMPGEQQQQHQQQQQQAGSTQLPSMDEETLNKVLADRIANHKSQLESHPEMATGTDDAPPEVTLPKPVARKRVRHVQIQTQHCVMRPMFTQTEPMESMVHDLEVKEFSTQTESSTTTETTTVFGSKDSSTSTVSSSGSMSPSRSHYKATAAAAGLVGTLTQHVSTTTTSVSTSTMIASPTSRASPRSPPRTSPKNSPRLAEAGSLATTMATTGTATLSPTESEELAQLRQQNTTLQTQVAHLKRDLASEIRARTRTAVAMQDTRDKFEMLSAMAYKKLKEMIFQRHVLEMEVRELRAQVDLLSEEGDLYQGAQQQQYQQQQNGHHHTNGDYVSTGRQ